MADTNFTSLPEAPPGFIWVDGASCVRVADIQAVRDEFLSVSVFVRGWEEPIEIGTPGGTGPDVTAALLDRMRAADRTDEK
ncbi:hypothetical protein AB0L71_28575 [Streptomyces sp. NPDC052052]|uniref:hypothetical protein n=1 Tax=Streptomyces sp. NPDC052052 TaxID=3154756 RepID=UPI0034325400